MKRHIGTILRWVAVAALAGGIVLILHSLSVERQARARADAAARQREAAAAQAQHDDLVRQLEGLHTLTAADDAKLYAAIKQLLERPGTVIVRQHDNTVQIVFVPAPTPRPSPTRSPTPTPTPTPSCKPHLIKHC